ncbi:hypothetical protein X798_05192 [Onchocerca flexuosa]|uniref:Uncharacterized protein n=2 Tax=Onchocerca flexuosa TaxID=387005 RepID=A0A183GZ02_9BILA|nr:hypothetical protein X798_05192 [Onchocerca flexuosa]VDO25876.1 unnamed protein product [Onchocerca flexuosa]
MGNTYSEWETRTPYLHAIQFPCSTYMTIASSTYHSAFWSLINYAGTRGDATISNDLPGTLLPNLPFPQQFFSLRTLLTIIHKIN